MTKRLPLHIQITKIKGEIRKISEIERKKIENSEGEIGTIKKNAIKNPTALKVKILKIEIITIEATRDILTE